MESITYSPSPPGSPILNSPHHSDSSESDFLASNTLDASGLGQDFDGTGAPIAGLVSGPGSVSAGGPGGDGRSRAESPSATAGDIPGTEFEQQSVKCLWEDCEKPFSYLPMLITHIHNDHIGVNKSTYTCEWATCPRRGLQQASRFALISHIRAHTGEKPFTCPLPECDKSFTRSDAMAKHMRLQHNMSPPLPGRNRKRKREDGTDGDGQTGSGNGGGGGGGSGSTGYSGNVPGLSTFKINEPTIPPPPPKPPLQPHELLPNEHTPWPWEEDTSAHGNGNGVGNVYGVGIGVPLHIGGGSGPDNPWDDGLSFHGPHRQNRRSNSPTRRSLSPQIMGDSGNTTVLVPNRNHAAVGFGNIDESDDISPHLMATGLDPKTGNIFGRSTPMVRYLIMKAKYRFVKRQHEELLEELRVARAQETQIMQGKEEMLNAILRQTLGPQAEFIIAEPSVLQVEQHTTYAAAGIPADPGSVNLNAGEQL